MSYFLNFQHWNGICVKVSLLSQVLSVGAGSEMLFIWVNPPEKPVDIFNIYNPISLDVIQIAFVFLFPKHTLKGALGNLVPKKIRFPGNILFLA